MYSTFYEFTLSREIIFFSVFYIAVFIISLFISIRGRAKYNIPKYIKLAFNVFLGIMTTTYLISSLYDYYYYGNIINSKTYMTVEGPYTYIRSNVGGKEAILVNGILFENIPRLVTSTFRDFYDFKTRIKEGSVIKVSYVPSFQVSGLNAVLKIDVKN